MLDKPIYKDWIFYLWLASIIMIVPGTLLSSYNGGGWGSFIIGLLFQSLVFLLIPTMIRSKIRSNRAEKNQIITGSTYNTGTVSTSTSTNSWKTNPITDKLNLSESLVSMKICQGCEADAQGMSQMTCHSCGGSTFTHEQREYHPPKMAPESKICPMCAEEVKFVAKKCRYCQHLFEEKSESL